MSKLIFSIGTDPEFFAKRVNGGITSVAGLLGCDKENKIALADDVRLQEDNVLAEFDINPCVGFDQFNETIKRGIELVNAKLYPLDMEIARGVSSHIYTKQELDSFDKSAFVFGCTPDYNAFTGLRNASPKAENPGLRTAGGHVHLGYSQSIPVNRENQCIAGVLCDYFLSLPSMAIDTDTRRKELYGKAGAIRFKEYGIEYRSLSNFWTIEDELRRLVYDQVEKVIANITTDKLMELNSIMPVERLYEVINNNDVQTADSFLKRLNVA